MATTYIDVSDIEDELGVKFSASGQPSRGRVQTMIEQVEAELTGIMSENDITTPLSLASNPTSFRMIQQAAVNGTCSRVVPAYAGLTQGAEGRAEQYRELYDQFVVRLEKAPKILSDATYVPPTGVEGVESGDTDHQDSRFETDEKF